MLDNKLAFVSPVGCRIDKLCENLEDWLLSVFIWSLLLLLWYLAASEEVASDEKKAGRAFKRVVIFAELSFSISPSLVALRVFFCNAAKFSLNVSEKDSNNSPIQKRSNRLNMFIKI